MICPHCGEDTDDYEPIPPLTEEQQRINAALRKNPEWMSLFDNYRGASEGERILQRIYADLCIHKDMGGVMPREIHVTAGSKRAIDDLLRYEVHSIDMGFGPMTIVVVPE